MSNEFSTLASWLTEQGTLFLQIADPDGRPALTRKIQSLSDLRMAVAEVKTAGTAVVISKEQVSHSPRDVITLRAYVQYTDLFSPANLTTISTWLREQRELFVQIELPDTSAEGFYHVIDSLPALERAINQIRHPQIEIYIWRDPDRSVPAGLIHTRPDEVMYFAFRKTSNSPSRSVCRGE